MSTILSRPQYVINIESASDEVVSLRQTDRKPLSEPFRFLYPYKHHQPGLDVLRCRYDGVYIFTLFNALLTTDKHAMSSVLMWNTICYLARMTNLHPCGVINSNRFYVEFHGITLIVYAISIIRTLLFTVYSHAFCVVSIVEVCWLEEREITKSLYWAIYLLYKTFRTRRDIAWALYVIKITSQVPHHPKYTQNT